MKKIKRVAAAALVGVIMMTNVGCSFDNAKYPDGTPTLANEKSMTIGAYHCPLPSDEAYQIVADSGITHMFANPTSDEYNGVGGDNWSADKGYGITDERFWSTALECAKKAGVNIILHFRGESHTRVSNYYEDILANDNFAGIMAIDEPSAPKFDSLATQYEHYKTVFKGYPYYVNLLPDYATEDQLGTKNDEGKTNAWKKYVDQYTDKLLSKYDEGQRIMLCDCYPLMNGTSTYARWLYNIEYLRKAADSVGGELQMFLQAQGFLSQWRQPTNVSELTYQMYVYMAYGVTGIHYYPYKMPKWSKENEKAIVDTEGNKTYMFDLAKAANTEIKKLDGVYLGFDWKAVVAKAGDNNIDGTNLNFSNCSDLKKKYGILSEVNCAQDAIVGCFENKEGYQAFLAVNFDQPKSSKKNEITLKFKGGVNKAIVYVKGEPETVDIVDGKLTKTLNAGDGIFVVPYKAV